MERDMGRKIYGEDPGSSTFTAILPEAGDPEFHTDSQGNDASERKIGESGDQPESM